MHSGLGTFTKPPASCAFVQKMHAGLRIAPGTSCDMQYAAMYGYVWMAMHGGAARGSVGAHKRGRPSEASNTSPLSLPLPCNSSALLLFSGFTSRSTSLLTHSTG